MDYINALTGEVFDTMEELTADCRKVNSPEPKTKYTVVHCVHKIVPFTDTESFLETEAQTTTYPTYRDALKSIPKTAVKTACNKWETTDQTYLIKYDFSELNNSERRNNND